MNKFGIGMCILSAIGGALSGMYITKLQYKKAQEIIFAELEDSRK